MHLVRYSKEYIDGVESFLDFAYSYGDPQGEEIQFPCAKCCKIRWTRRNVVYDHLICYGFVKGYTRWINHEEWDIKLNVDNDMDYSRDDIDGLLNDQFRDVAQAEGVYDGPNEDAKKFYNLVEEASQELYPGMIIRMMNFVILVELHDILNLLKLIMANSLTWHDEECSKDGKLRHPADGLAWKDFDRLHPDFALDCRNDHTEARYDLKDMGIRKNLHPKDTKDSKRTKFAKACFSMTNGEKSIFCGVLKTTKLPDGSASNISSRARNNDECDPSDAETVSLFPNKGVPLGSKKTNPFILDNKSLSQAYAYLLGNCDEVQEYIRIVDFVELDYYGHVKVVLFKCDWYEVENEADGLTYVYFNKRCSQEKPFVLGSQVHQCFYVQDPYDEDRHYVRKTVPRDLFNMGDEVEYNLPQNYENEPSEYLMGPSIPKDNGEVLLTRTDVPETIIDVPSEEFVTQQLKVEYEEEFEDEFADEFEDESENEYEDEFENEYEDEFKDESAEEFEDDAP
ncbi:hypothetical protein KY289_016237 [Solanum tuberosum]|nr:hypothetical protein KY289_016237 [Solanum tuberosum]